MSDSEKLRKTYGNLCLALSLFLLTLSISSIWCAVVFPPSAILVIPFALFIFFPCCIFSAIDAYDYFVDVSKERFEDSDKAKLLRVNGLIYLAWSFTFFAIGICCLWGIFVFWGIIGFILLLIFFTCLIMFGLFIDKACSKFMAIKKHFDEER